MKGHLETNTSQRRNSRTPKVSTFLRVALFTVALITSLSARAAFASTNRNPIDVISPKQEIDYNIHRVEAKVQLESGTNRTTLKIVLNGRDITKLFRPEDDQRRSGLLTKHLHKSDGLRAGRNTLVVQAVNQSGLDFLVTRVFYITPPKGGGLGETAPSPQVVTVSSSIVNSSDLSSVDSYLIFFNAVEWSFSGICPAGMTTNYGMKLLVVDRQTLQVTDQKCFDTSGSTGPFQSYLASLTSTQLVIASSFLQASNPQSGVEFDTSSIGGTAYTCTSGVCDSPKIYSIIGVPGLKAGQAYETSVGPTLAPGFADYPTLFGVLAQDQNSNYNFVPNFFVRFKVIPGDSSGNPVSVQLGTAPSISTINPPALPTNWAGGYWLLLLHRYNLADTSVRLSMRPTTVPVTRTA